MMTPDIFPARDAAAISPSAAPLPEIPRAIYVGGAGDLVVDFGDGAVTLTVAAGAVLPIRPPFVLPATTATNLVALF